jgi:uncharacterized phage protein (TIGR01671 family)
MRQLKFRAYHSGSKEMYWFDLMWGNRHATGSGYIGMLPTDETEIKRHLGMGDSRRPVDPHDCEIMQYTGLKDKNGKEIYEGDVVAAYRGSHPVIFENGCFMWDGEPLCYDLGEGVETALPERWATVIGNIYENAELLNSTP